MKERLPYCSVTAPTHCSSTDGLINLRIIGEVSECPGSRHAA
jgi:hypothetical protein